jgi:hypothetical protein
MNIDVGTLTHEGFLKGLQAAGFAPPVAVTRDASYALGDHAHDFEAWALVTQGEITIEVGGIVSRFPAGRSFRLPAGTPHKEWVGCEGVQYLAGRKE